MSKVRVATLLLALQTLFAPFASSANACEVKCATGERHPGGDCSKSCQ